MRNSILILLLTLIIAFAFYFLGKKNGSNVNDVNVIHNVALIKEIAEMSSLEVTGTTSFKISNRGEDDGVWSKFKNYLGESTLQLSIPYDAKYGVDIGTQKVEIDTKAGIAKVYFPPCKLLSLQLRLDRVDAMSKTGLLNTATIDDYVKAQKQLYEAANKALAGNTGHIKLAEEHIRFILEKYYAPLGLKVECIFEGRQPGTPN